MSTTEHTEHTLDRVDEPASARIARIVAGRRSRHRRHAVATIVLGVLVFALFAVALMVGNTFYTPDEVIRVILGETVPGASFTVGDLRLPRAVLAVLTGIAFGMAGVCFQTMLRNPLASPDIIGISNGAGAAAVFGIIVLSVNGPVVSLLALGGAVVTALVIYLLSIKGGFAGTRLILIGIGVAAMLQSVISYMLSRAANWDIQTAMQWLTGSLNNASWERVLPMAIAAAIIVPLMLSQGRALGALQLGDDSAAGLGIRVNATRLLLILGAVALLAFATAATGPIAFVAFMAGPIAARITGPGANLLLPSAFVGAVLVLGGDLIGQFAFGTRYPVGVITGVVGAPYLIYLLIRTNRSGVRYDRLAQPVRRGVTLAYGDRTIIDGLDLQIAPGRITTIVGANGCGKSTLLRSLARLLSPSDGQIVLDGRSVHARPTKEVARILGLLPQSPVAPEGIAVADLVGRGRHPHQKMLARWSAHDYEVVADALDATGISDLADRSVDELSGGQRQRVWIAMALAQETDILLLDEPTTFLDVAHQVEVLDLLTDLSVSRGTTIVMVLHDLNLAARYADELVAMKDGRVHATGAPQDIVTAELVEEVFGLANQITIDPVSGKPMVTPIGRHHVR